MNSTETEFWGKMSCGKQKSQRVEVNVRSIYGAVDIDDKCKSGMLLEHVGADEKQ